MVLLAVGGFGVTSIGFRAVSGSGVVVLEKAAAVAAAGVGRSGGIALLGKAWA